MLLRLVVVSDGKRDGQEVVVNKPRYLIGRDPRANLQPASILVSARHCMLLVSDSSVIVQDLQSTNGTFVNEQRVRGEKELRNGDILRVGPLRFRVDMMTMNREHNLSSTSPSDKAVETCGERPFLLPNDDWATNAEPAPTVQGPAELLESTWAADSSGSDHTSKQSASFDHPDQVGNSSRIATPAHSEYERIAEDDQVEPRNHPLGRSRSHKPCWYCRQTVPASWIQCPFCQALVLK